MFSPYYKYSESRYQDTSAARFCNACFFNLLRKLLFLLNALSCLNINSFIMQVLLQKKIIPSRWWRKQRVLPLAEPTPLLDELLLQDHDLPLCIGWSLYQIDQLWLCGPPCAKNQQHRQQILPTEAKIIWYKHSNEMKPPHTNSTVAGLLKEYDKSYNFVCVTIIVIWNFQLYCLSIDTDTRGRWYLNDMRNIWNIKPTGSSISAYKHTTIFPKRL